MGYAADVVFDFEGALDLAAELWRMADRLQDLSEDRSGKAGTALDDWVGAFADAFVERKNGEYQSAQGLAEMLQAEAHSWAEQWKAAMDQDNNNRWARECDRVRSDRSNAAKVIGWATGHDDLPDRPPAADVPSSPHFTATRRRLFY